MISEGIMEVGGISAIEKLKGRIMAAAERGALPHACIIVGPEGAGKYEFARFIAAALLCGSGKPPCLKCSDCRKVMNGIHPDVKTADNETRTIKVEVARMLRRDAQIKPNEAGRKVYIIRGAERLNPSAANALLKVLEDPPAGAAFLLTVRSPELLPVTLRSRCEAVYMPAPARFVESQPEAGEFWELLMSGDEVSLAGFTVSHEKLSREKLVLFLESLRSAASRAAAEACAKGPNDICKNKEPGVLLGLAEHISEARRRYDANVGTGHIIAALAAACMDTLYGSRATARFGGLYD